MDTSHRLAAFASQLRFADLAPAVVQEAKRLILDTVGCGLGGHAVDKGRLAVALATRSGGAPEATILGHTQQVPAAQAAFANGDLMNALDWNALLPPSHVPPYIIAPAMAVAETQRRSGRDLIAAAVVGMEVAGRVGTSLGGLRATPGGFPLRVWGISANQLGATAAAAHGLALDAERMLHALGLAAYHAPVPSHVKYNYTKEVGYAKFGPSGWMAQGGMVTAQLAEMGYRGDTSFLETERGFWAMNGAPEWDASKVTSDLGQHWVFMNAGYKYWPTCGFYQSPLDAFTALIDTHGLQPEEIEDVVYQIEQFAGIDKYVTTEPNDHIEAAASGPFVFAVAAHRIPRGPGWQARAVIDDPAIRAFMKKVRHEVNPRSELLRRQDLETDGLPYLRHRPARVVIRARGQVFERSVDYANWLSMGVDACRPTDEALAEKFRLNAEGLLGHAQTEAAIDMLLRLEEIDDVMQVMRHLRRA
ncbi:MAG: MmgE/PrpD family protein [Rhodoferax sp.]|nr:MmgE/PrpD family protein [Rhodoferax sp.]